MAGARCYYYDTRFLLLPLASHLQGYLGSDQTSATSSSTMALTALLLAAFLLTAIRVHLTWHVSATHNCNARRFLRCCGAAAISIPLMFSLLVLLILPYSCFWFAYFLILLMSLWSDAIQAFLTRYSYQEECHILLPLFTHQLPAPSSPVQQGTDE